MQKKSTFVSLLVVYTILVTAGYFNRETLFHWTLLERISRFLLLTTWICLLISLFVLIALITMHGSLRRERANLYVVLLHICNGLFIISLLSEISWATVQQAFPGLLPAYTTARIEVSYEPPMVPVVISVDSEGKVVLGGNTALVTPIGTFRVGAGVSTELFPPPDRKSLLLVISHRQNGVIVRDGYKVTTGQDEVYIATKGNTTIHLAKNELDIDTTQGEVQDVEIQGNVTTASG